MSIFKFQIKHNLAVTLFFSAYFLVGLILFRDYGVSWDEPRDKRTGELTVDFMTSHSQELFSWPDKYFGTGFQWPLVALERALNLTDSRDVYLMRHFATFLFFFAGVFVFYKLASEILGNRWLGLLGAFFLVASPRIFADSFYNSKDIPFLSSFVIAIYTMKKYLEKPSIRRAALHGFFSALCIDIRLFGLLVPALTVFFSIKDRVKPLSFLLFTFSFLLFTVFIWPVLWQDTIQNFTSAVFSMGKFSAWGGQNLYLGQVFPSLDVPWHYTLVWLAVTTPISYLVLFVVGVFALGFSHLRGAHLGGVKAHPRGVLAAWIFLPWLATVFLHTEVFDGWRHFFFIYPAFLIIALFGVKFLLGGAHRGVLALIIGFIVFDLLGVVRFMTLNHPYQNVYFNALAGGVVGAKDKFELDYWGLSFREGLEYIVKTDPRPQLLFSLYYGPAETADILPESDRLRLVPVANQEEFAKVNYILTTYRLQKEEDFKNFNEVYNTKVDNTKIMSVFKVK